MVCEWKLGPESDADADMDSLSGLSDEGALCSRWLCVAAASKPMIGFGSAKMMCHLVTAAAVAFGTARPMGCLHDKWPAHDCLGHQGDHHQC